MFLILAALAWPALAQFEASDPVAAKALGDAIALMQRAEGALSVSDATRYYQEASELLEDGLRQALLPSQQAELASKLAECMVKLAGAQSSAKERRALYLRAIGKFHFAAEKSPARPDGRAEELWAEALIETGKLDDDQVLLLQAVDQLRAYLQRQPANLDARFKLVQAYALLGQADPAINELQLSAKQDAGRTRAWAQDQPDLKLLRDRAGFPTFTDYEPSEPKPDFVYQAGVSIQREAEKLDPSPTAVPLYQKSIQKFQQATESRSDYYPAQLMWAHGLAKLSRLATNTAERVALTQSARERFAIAAQCPGSDWRVYYDWARLLTMEADAQARQPEVAGALLKEASEHYEKALPLTQYSSDKAAIEHDSAMCLILLAEREQSALVRRALYRKAIARIDSALEKSPKTMNARSYGLWGVALLQLSKIDNDRSLMRQATERLLSTLQLEPGNNAARYNLTCAYALLDQADNALRHLQIILKNDPQRIFYNAAANDEDLWSLRSTPEYNRLFNNTGTNSSDIFDKPRLSN